MTKKKTESFVKGALILAIANVLVKVIGAVFRIPLTNLVGTYTMGLYSYAYRYYSILLTIATAGIPIAISKMVSESRALGKHRETGRIFRIALTLCITIGFVGTLLLMTSSGLLASAVIKDMNVIPSIIALSPAILFMAVTAGFRGYFQGHENMMPTALTQIIEALSRLIVGLALAWVLLSFGLAEKYVSSGVILGITAGTVLSVLLMIFVAIYTGEKRTKKQYAMVDEQKKSDILFGFFGGFVFIFLILCPVLYVLFVVLSVMRARNQRDIPSGTLEDSKSSKIMFALLKIAVPITLGSLVMNLTTIIDSVFIPLRLSAIGYGPIETTTMYSIYDNYALPLFNLVPSIIISLNVSVTPTISAAYAVKDNDKLHGTILSALRIVIIFTLPAAVGISVLSNPILSILFSSPEAIGGVPVAAPMLSILGIASFFLCASSLTSTTMQALGKAFIPLLTMAIGAVVKIIVSYVLIGIPGVELMGAAIGTVLCYVVITVLNMIMLRKHIGFKPKLIETYVRPIISCAIMGVVVWGTYTLLSTCFGNLLSVAGSIMLGVIVYFVAMIVSKGITKEDIMGLPKGEKIAAILFKEKK